MRLADYPNCVLFGKTFSCFVEFSTFLWIFVIYRKSSKEMSAYRFCLGKMAAFDLGFSFTLVWFLWPDVLFPLPVCIAEGFCKYLGSYGAIIGLFVVVYCGMCMLFAVNDCCYVRAAALFQRMDIIEAARSKMGTVYLILFYVGSFGILGFLIYFPCRTAEGAKIYLQRINRTDIIAAIDWDSVVLVSTDFDRWYYIPTMIIAIGGLMVIQGSNMTFTFLVHRKLMSLKAHLSAQTMRMQSEMTRMMATQVMFPCFAISVPVIVYLIGLRSNIPEILDSDYLYMFCGFLLLCYPLVNCLACLLSIRPYRRYIYTLLQKLPCCLKNLRQEERFIAPISYTEHSIKI